MKFVFSAALLSAFVAASQEEPDAEIVPKTTLQHLETGWEIIKNNEQALKPDSFKNDAQAADAWMDWIDQATQADFQNLQIGLSKLDDDIEMTEAETKQVKTFNAIFSGALSFTMAGIATLGAAFLL